MEPSSFEVIIDGEEIIHRKRSAITFEKHGHKPPEKNASEYTLAFLWWD
jgi:hypothetical protein